VVAFELCTTHLVKYSREQVGEPDRKKRKRRRRRRRRKEEEGGRRRKDWRARRKIGAEQDG
jgi:hypothetical protein